MKNNISFFLYQISDILFTSSTRAFGMLFSWWMIEVLNLDFQLGWFIFSSWFLQVLFLVFMSNLGDRFNKKSIVLCCIIPTSLLFIFASIIDKNLYIPLGIIYIFASISAILIQPIGTSILPEISNKNKLESAFKYRGIVNSVNIILGPAISGIVIHYLNIDGALIFISLMAISSIIGFYFIKNQQKEKPSHQHKSNIGSIKIITKNPTEASLVIVASFFNFTVVPLVTYITPLIIINEFKLSALQVGIAEATFGVGMMIGSTIIIKYMNKFFCKARGAFISALTIAVCIAGISTATSLIGLCSYMLISGIGLIIYNINTTSIRCLATPESHRNAMESKFLAICIVSIPLGMISATYMIENYDIRALLLIFSALMGLMSFLVLFSPKYVEISKMTESQLEGYYGKIYPEAYHPKNR
ncbi:MFS transporter [Xenorhabdus japonica]|uniref:Predicted arabinose efflux permease, MFS family n=1 Tax=Xenorhabdus japonica TaxID=53341 RepID=A0A1I5A6E5_9GAMM|nr:MFS transporter [Xenorhabdus japonica]SFN58015.1 Predicted arabinose efflux permease, MFS family [Xenorhabdus japonica]